jgi:hypothetical protein
MGEHPIRQVGQQDAQLPSYTVKLADPAPNFEVGLPDLNPRPEQIEHDFVQRAEVGTCGVPPDGIVLRGHKIVTSRAEFSERIRIEIVQVDWPY